MKTLPPIAEFYDDDMPNLTEFFTNGKKEFWRFDKYIKMGIDRCVLFFPRDFKKIKSIYKKCKLIYEFKSASSVSPVYAYDNKVFIALCPLGGPASANLMEELYFVGVKTFLGTGSCGAITEVDFNGITWTTDAIYRETPMRIQARKNDGAVCAEMETASLSAVAKKRNVKYACLLYFSDYNNGKEWTTRFYNKFELRERILNYSIEAILSL